MRAYICWNCGNLCKCNKRFPNGRPKGRSECAEYTDPPPEPTRITHQEMANVLGCSVWKIEKIIASVNGVRCLMKKLARKGIMLTYEKKEKRIYFYKEENRNG